MAETCEPSEYFISDDIDIKGNVIVEQTLTGEIMPSSKYNGNMAREVDSSQFNKDKKKCTTNTYKDMNNPTEIGKKRHRIGSFPKSSTEGTRQRTTPYDPAFYRNYIKGHAKDDGINVTDSSGKPEGFSYFGGKKSRRKTRSSKKSHRKSSKKQRKSRRGGKSRRGRR